MKLATLATLVALLLLPIELVTLPLFGALAFVAPVLLVASFIDVV